MDADIIEVHPASDEESSGPQAQQPLEGPTASGHDDQHAATTDQYDTEEEEAEDSRRTAHQRKDAKTDPSTRHSARLANKQKPVTTHRVQRRCQTPVRHPGKKAQEPRHVYANVNVQAATMDKANRPCTQPQESQNWNPVDATSSTILATLSQIGITLQQMCEERERDRRRIERLQEELCSTRQAVVNRATTPVTADESEPVEFDSE